MHFYALNQMNNRYYGGKTKIIPIELEQFMKLVENSYNYANHPSPIDVRRFLDAVISKIPDAKNEQEWGEMIQYCVNQWLAA